MIAFSKKVHFVSMKTKNFTKIKIIRKMIVINAMLKLIPCPVILAAQICKWQMQQLHAHLAVVQDYLPVMEADVILHGLNLTQVAITTSTTSTTTTQETTTTTTTQVTTTTTTIQVTTTTTTSTTTTPVTTSILITLATVTGIRADGTSTITINHKSIMTITGSLMEDMDVHHVNLNNLIIIIMMNGARIKTLAIITITETNGIIKIIIVIMVKMIIVITIAVGEYSIETTIIKTVKLIKI